MDGGSSRGEVMEKWVTAGGVRIDHGEVTSETESL